MSSELQLDVRHLSRLRGKAGMVFSLSQFSPPKGFGFMRWCSLSFSWTALKCSHQKQFFFSPKCAGVVWRSSSAQTSWSRDSIALTTGRREDKEMDNEGERRRAGEEGKEPRRSCAPKKVVKSRRLCILSTRKIAIYFGFPREGYRDMSSSTSPLSRKFPRLRQLKRRILAGGINLALGL